MKKIELWAGYWNGQCFRGTFDSEEQAQKHYDDNQHKFRDYAGAKHGFPYAYPIFVEIEVAD